MLTTIEKLVILSEAPLVRGLPLPALSRLADAAEEVRAAAGVTLWERGDEADKLWFVVDGMVLLDDGLGGVLAAAAPADVAAAPVFAHEKHDTTAVVSRPAILLAVPRPVFLETLVSQPGAATALFAELSARLRACKVMSPDVSMDVSSTSASPTTR
jgi:CRP-like cAMP-binding protein